VPLQGEGWRRFLTASPFLIPKAGNSVENLNAVENGLEWRQLWSVVTPERWPELGQIFHLPSADAE
jgi:hypothetical protein